MMTFRFRKGMTLREYVDAVRAERISKEQAAKAKSEKKIRPTMRSVWFVDARRGQAEVSLPAPDGERQANAMAEHLNGFGWTAEALIKSTFADDPRFHELR